MNWSKIKDIMIIILVIINLFLIFDIALTRYNSQALPKGTGDSFASILEKNRITIEKKLIPRHYETRRDIAARCYDIDSLTKLFIGEKVNYVSQGTSIIATTNDKRLTLSGACFEYTTLRESVEKKGDDIMRALKSLGITLTGAYFDSDTGLVKVMIDKECVEGVYLDVFLTKNGEIASANGVWPIIEIGGMDDKVSVIKTVNEICNVLPEGSHISDIEKIYIFEEVGNSVVIKSGWKIYNQGRGYIVG